MELNTDLSHKTLKIKNSNGVLSSLHRIALEVCEKHGLTMRDFRAKCNFQALVAMRFEYYYRAAAETRKSLPQIASLTGCHHTTVGYGMAKYALHYKLPVPRSSYWQRAIERPGFRYNDHYPRRYHQLNRYEKARTIRAINFSYRESGLDGRINGLLRG